VKKPGPGKKKKQEGEMGWEKWDPAQKNAGLG